MRTNEDLAVIPIDYVNGVMDEEVSPILKAYIEDLKSGEGALVIFRKEDDVSSDVLLESTIKGIAGYAWRYVSGGPGKGKMQDLVNKLSEDAQRLRMPNSLFSVPEKIKATDSHGICFGLIGPKDGVITSIKGIVYQQLNMGFNGDLLLHEGDIILQSLIDNQVFHNEKQEKRPIRFATYGAGGSSSHDVNPGVMTVSDGVIDVRSHVNPYCMINFLEGYCDRYAKEHPGVRGAERKIFSGHVELIKEKLKSDPGYCGIAIVHDMAELTRQAKGYTNVESETEIMKEMPAMNKSYYGEITFASPLRGSQVVHRIGMVDGSITTRPGFKQEREFEGDDGQKQVIKELRQFMSKLSQVNPLPKESNDFTRSMETKIAAARRRLDLADNKVFSAQKRLSSYKKKGLGADDKRLLKSLEEKIEDARQIRKQAHFMREEQFMVSMDNPDERLLTLSELSLEKKGIIEREEKTIKTANKIVFASQKEIEVLLKKNSQSTALRRDSKYIRFFKELEEAEIARLEAQGTFVKMTKEYEALKEADTRLRRYIEEIELIHKKFVGEGDSVITGSGNFFFYEEDKAAFGVYGAKTVEMENALFVEILQSMLTNPALANKIFIDTVHITKIAADPLKIHHSISDSLNQWAQKFSMTLDEYVEAFMWADAGQSFENFPECGQWKVAEEISKKDPILATAFFNFGTLTDPKIVNPFWKEIGTDLVKEIRDGKAFKGDAYKNFGLDKEPLKKDVDKLKDLATRIIKRPASDLIKKKSMVKTLFSQYLELMKPMHLGGGKYRAYARAGVITDGYVQKSLSDWDQPIYKSSNTALLAKLAKPYIQAQEGKRYLDPRAVRLEQLKESVQIESALKVYSKIIRLIKMHQIIEAHVLGVRFLNKSQGGSKPVSKSLSVNSVDEPIREREDLEVSYRVKIDKLMQEMLSFPKILSQYHIRKEKLTGPRIASLIETISKKEGAEVALVIAEKFLIWIKTAHKHYVVNDIKKIQLKLRQEIQAEQKTTRLGESSFKKPKDSLEIQHNMKLGVADIREKGNATEPPKKGGPD